MTNNSYKLCLIYVITVTINILASHFTRDSLSTVIIKCLFLCCPPPTPLAGEAVQWDDRGRQGLRQRQQALC